LEQTLTGVKNYNIAVKKRGDDIIFLRKIVPGSADDSYGIEVAKLAGVPNSVVHRAKEVLVELESGTMPSYQTERVAEPVNSFESQLSFTGAAEHDVVEELKKITVETLTPIEALNKLYDLKKLLN
jgi:DNA mismatch repair protein MutS